MGLFDWGKDDFAVLFDGVDLDAPGPLDIGDDVSVDAELQTVAGSDDYWVDEVQLYLQTDTGTYIVDRQEPANPIGGGMDRNVRFRFEIEGERIAELADAGVISPGGSYRMETYTIFQDIDKKDVDTYRDTSTEDLRFR